MSAIMADPCAKCGKATVDGCSNGKIQVDDTTVRQCVNMAYKLLREHLGEEIASAPRIHSTPLLKLVGNGSFPSLDLTKENLLIQSTWPTLVRHLKWVLSYKGVRFNCSNLTDKKIIDVFVGSESYQHRQRGVRDDADLVVYNNLDDLVAAPDLLVIRLGYLGYKNIAAAGALKEALMIRDTLKKPTWVLDDMRDTCAWNHSRSLEVEDYLNGFTRVKLTPTQEDYSQTERLTPHGVVIDDDGDDVLEPAPATPKLTAIVPIVVPIPTRKIRQEFVSEPKPVVSMDEIADAASDGFLYGNSKKKKGWRK